jgi:FAD/FMN-containing dehydrogenase/Fe-S oxidoreductase
MARRLAEDSKIIEIDRSMKGLAAELSSRLRGEVRFDNGSRALYSTDASNYRQIPIGVVVPRDADDVVEAVAVARSFGAPILARGGGTSLAGQCCNVAVVMDMTKYMYHVQEIDAERRLGRVQPGCVLDRLRDKANDYGLTFGPDPATHNHCTIGGMLGNNSCGVHSVMAQFAGNGARTSDNTHEVEILTYDGLRMRVGPTSNDELTRIIGQGGRRGQIYSQLKDLRDKYADLIRARFPKIPRRVSGYNLDELLPENGFNVARSLVGTESTCVIFLEALMCLIPNPAERTLLILGYKDIFHAGDHVPLIMEHRPIGLEGIDELLFDWVKRAGSHPHGIKLMPEGHGFLLVEFGGDNRKESVGKARELMEVLKRNGTPPSMKIIDNNEEEEAIWGIREGSLGSTAWVSGHPDTWPGWEDSAVSPERVGDYLRDLRKLMKRYNYNPSLYGHLGQGCVHCRVEFDVTSAQGISKYHSFIEEAADLVISYGGTLSGEHGDGQSRAELLSKMYGNELVEAFNQFKTIWDPEWKMNPGKVVDPYRITENLRLGVNYNPPNPLTQFKYRDDDWTFSRAALRCVGIGECRRESGGTMCPSYMVTREEMHSTRGRAHLLFEMLEEDTITRGWQSEHVKEALDLCLACKGCKGECPVKVDMATYKAEFMSHYYENRLRPLHAYAFGLVHTWAKLASYIPDAANFFTQTESIERIAKSLAGVAPERKIPAFAPKTFKQWFRERGPRHEARQGVLLWPDTFNNYFHPEVAQAAVEVLEDAGYRVIVPQVDLCCGRPLYDYGMLDRAKRWLQQIVDNLRPLIRDGVSLVGLEPSCVSVFRDELTNLFPHDHDAVRLSKQSFILSEFLENIDYKPPKLDRKAVIHGHCHHKAILGMSHEERVLEKMGLECQLLDSGCCGMAGAFGFEAGEHYEVSIKCGERVLLPAVREAATDTLIISNGFSCREQIAQTTDRKALHLAEIIRMAMVNEVESIPNEYPERSYLETHRTAPEVSGVKAALALSAGALVAGSFAWGIKSAFSAIKSWRKDPSVKQYSARSVVRGD